MFRSVLIAAGVMGLANGASAATLYWDGSNPNNLNSTDGGSGIWNTASNWDLTQNGVNAITLGTTDDAIFGGTAGTVTLSAAFSAQSLTFNTTGYTVTGSTLSLAGTPVITTASGVSATISSVLAGTKAWTKNGTGTLILSGANTFTRALSISAGTVNIQNAAALGSTGTGTTVSSDAALEIQGGITVGAEAITLNGTGISGGGALRNVSGNNSMSGAITLGSGTEIASDGGALTLSGAIGGAAQNLTVDGAGNVTLSGVIGTTTGTLTKSGSGTLTLSGGSANTFTGLTTVNAGQLILSKTAGNALAGAVTVAGGTLTLGAANQIAATPVGVSGGVFDIGANSDTVGAVTLTSGFITGTTGVLTGTSYAVQSGVVSAILGGTSVALTKSTAGTVILSGANTYTGATTVSAGTLRLGLTNALSSSTAVTVDSGATLDLNGFADTIGSLSGAGNVILGGGTLTVGGNNSSTTFSGIISEAGGLIKTGTGMLTLSGNNTYTGGTTVAAGTVSFATGALGATGVVTMDGGTLQWNGTNTEDISSRLAMVAAKTAVFDTNGNDVTFASAIGGGTTGALTKTGAGMLTLSGNNTYTGGTTVTAGAVSFATGALGATGPVTMDGGMLQWNGPNTEDISSRLVMVAAKTAVFDTNGNDVTFASAIGGGTTGALTKTGAGTLTLSGNNTYSGLTTVSAGVLNIRSGTALGTTAGGVSVTTGAALEIQGDIAVGAETITLNGTGVSGGGALRNVSGNNSMSGAITLGSATEISSDSGTLTLSGAIGGAAQNMTVDGAGNVTLSGVIGTTTGTLTKNGVGTLSLSGGSANTFTGLTTVNAGQLILSKTAGNALAGAVTVAGGTLTLGAANQIAATAIGVSGGVFDIGANNDTVGAVTLTSGNITGGTGVLTGTSYAMQSGTVSAILGGSGGLTKTTAGTVTLSRANTYTGLTAVNAGTLVYDINDALSTGAITVSGGTLDIGNFNDSVGVVTLISGNITGGAGVLTGSSYAMESGTVSAILGGTGTLTKTTTGTVTLSGANTYTGATAINAGVLNIRNDSALGTIAGGVTVADGAAFELQGDITIGAETLSLAGTGVANGGVLRNISGNNTWQGDITLANSPVSHRINSDAGTLTLGNISESGTAAKTVTFGGVGDIAVNGVISGASDDLRLVKDGSGALSLSGSNTYTASTTVSAGTLSVTMLANGGAASGIGQSANTADKLVISGGATLAYTGSSAATTDRLFTVGAGGAILANNGTGALTFSNTGTVAYDTADQARTITLAGSNAGDNMFALKIANNGSGVVSFIKDGAGKWTLNNATNNFTGGTTIVAGILQIDSLAALGTGSVSNSGTLVFNSSGIFTNAISGSGAVTQSGSGTTILIAANTYSGATSIFAGTLQVGNGGVMGTLGDGTGAVTNNAALVFNRSDDFTVANSISGSGTITKNGAGKLTLSGAGTFSGATFVDAGTLAVTGSLANSDITVRSGARLMGNVTAHNIILEAGASIAPGSSIGTINAIDFTWNGGTTLSYELGASGINDRILLTGALIKSGSGAYIFDFNGSGQAGASYTLITALSTNFVAPDFTVSNLASGLVGNIAVFNGADIVLTVVPEGECTVGVGLFAGLALLGRRRAKKK